MIDPWSDGSAETEVHALARAVRRVGVSVVASWSSRCDWCKGGLVCAGDPYVCSYITAEVESDLLDDPR